MRLLVWGVVFGLTEAYKSGASGVMSPSDEAEAAAPAQNFIDLGIQSTAKKLRAGLDRTLNTVKCSTSSDARCKPKARYQEDLLKLMRQHDDAALRNLAQLRTNFKNYGVTAAEAQDIWNQAVKSTSFDLASFEATYGSKAPAATAAAATAAAVTPLATPLTGAVVAPTAAPIAGLAGAVASTASPIASLSGAIATTASPLASLSGAVATTASPLAGLSGGIATTARPLTGVQAGLVSTAAHP